MTILDNVMMRKWVVGVVVNYDRFGFNSELWAICGLCVDVDCR